MIGLVNVAAFVHMVKAIGEYERRKQS